MARIISGGAGRALQRERASGEMPPSTLAAQIVQSHLKLDKRSNSRDRVNFRQLLEELQTLPNVDESDINSNYLLVTVILQAGLESFKDIDPFNQTTAVNDDVLASLDVIDLVIRQTPGVLFLESAGANDPDSQLCWKILPQLFALLSRPDEDHAILRKVAKLLSSMISIFHRDPLSWNASTIMLSLFRICIDGMERYLRNVTLLVLTLFRHSTSTGSVAAICRYRF